MIGDMHLFFRLDGPTKGIWAKHVEAYPIFSGWTEPVVQVWVQMVCRCLPSFILCSIIFHFFPDSSSPNRPHSLQSFRRLRTLGNHVELRSVGLKNT